MFVSEVSRFVFFHLMISVLKISQAFWWWVWGVFECFRVFSISPSRTPMMIKYDFVCWRVEGTKLYRVGTSWQVIFEHAAFYWTSGHWPKKRSSATKKDLSLLWEDIYCIFVVLTKPSLASFNSETSGFSWDQLRLPRPPSKVEVKAASNVSQVRGFATRIWKIHGIFLNSCSISCWLNRLNPQLIIQWYAIDGYRWYWDG